MPFVNAGGQTPPSTLNNPSGTQGIDLSGVPDFMRPQILAQIQQQMQARQQMTKDMQGSGLQNVGVQSPYTTFKATAPPGFASAPGFGTAQANDATANANQNALVAMLQNQAAGRGPSVAQGLLNQATQQNIQNTASGVASNRSLSPAEAARIQLEGGVQAQGQAAGQAATMRAQEQLGAQGLLGNVLAGQRGQDIATQQALGQLQLGQGAQNLQAQAMDEQAQLANLQANLAQEGINTADTASNRDFWGKIVGGALGGFGALGAKAGSAAHGALIPGYAKVPGDSSSNDTVPAKLSPGEIVLPRSVAQSKDAPEKAAEFVRAIRRKKASEDGGGYGRVLAMQREHEQRLKKLEMWAGGRVK